MKTWENKPYKIIWHHSADASPELQLGKIDLEHKSRGYPKSSLGFFVGYHYLIEHDGKLVQCRKETEIGTHAKPENIHSIGICLTGNFSFYLPTEKQKETAGKLVKEILERWEIHIARIIPHRKVSATECPGKLLKDDWLACSYLQFEINRVEKIIQWLRLKISQI